MINDSTRKKGVSYAYSAYSNVIFVNGEAGDAKTADFVNGYQYDSGVALRFVFRNGHTPATAGNLTINGFPVKVYDNQGNLVDLYSFDKPVYSGTDIVTVVECMQPGTTFEAYFQNGAIPCWVVIGNPTVLRHDNYEILADGTNTGLMNHPVDSFYWTHSSDNPQVTFGGGTWEQIKGKFLWAKEDDQTAGDDGGAKTVTLTTNNLPSHSHYYTPSGSITMNSHTHSFTPSGSISVTAHTYTPGGSVSGGKHKHTVTAKGTISGGAYSFSGTEGDVSVSGGNHRHDAFVQHYSGHGTLSGGHADTTSSAGQHYTDYSGDLSMSGKFTPKGSVSVTTNPTFSGTSVDTSEVTPSSYTWTGTAATLSHSGTFTGTAGTTGGTTVTGTFSGTRTTTETSGSGTSVDKMPPYLVEYCWKRTA